MDHVAIDIGGRESQVCRRKSDGAIVEEKRVATLSLASYLGALQPSRVIVETCAEAFGIARSATAAGHQVRVVPATLAPSLGVGARGIKTDVRDARALSEASCRMDLPSVHIPSVESRQRKSACGMREALVGSRTQLINTVRGWMRAEAERVKTGAPESFPERVRAHLQRAGRPVPSYVERQLGMIDSLTAQIFEADAEVKTLATTDEVCRRLMTVPGVGPNNAVLFRAILDEQSRFESAASVGSYLGLTPSERSSSTKTRRSGITKAGSPRMRRLLVQAVWTARRCRPNDPMVRWSLDVEKRRGKAVAVVALARKLSSILYAIWRDGTTYDPRRGAEELPTSAAEVERMAQGLELLGRPGR